MANSAPLSSPLCERIPIKISLINRAPQLIILLLLISLLVYRLLFFNINHGFAWLLAFLCESWFTFEYILLLNTLWTPVHFKTCPETLSQRDTAELPAVDLFVTTADVVLEAPIMTVNTVLSVMAVDYPVHKLACYVSDDGYSPIILYSLIEASKFARLWIPFCKKYDVQVRAPFRYFSGDVASAPSDDADKNSSEFHKEKKKMKDEYEKLRQRIEKAANGMEQIECSGEYANFANTNKSDHPSIIKVIWENKERFPHGIPHLIYVSREKRPNCSHHYKAGALNVLTRVSGVMTNAPFMLNVDCDNYVNNPKIVLYAMCSFLGLKPQECAFVQFPQDYYNQLKDDPLGTQVVAAFQILGHGMAGIQGPPYAGTGCFHRRKVIYGFFSDNADVQGKEDDEKALKKSFGNSMEFINSVAQILKDDYNPVQDLSSVVQMSSRVASCGYEQGTLWGTKIGCSYESVAEDFLTGMRIHRQGWRSVACMPDPPGFQGKAPTSGPVRLIQRKRLIAGLLQVFFSKSNPILGTLNAQLEFRQCLACMWIILAWAMGSVFELCYSLLPAYCIIANSNFLPRAHEPAMVMLVTRLFIQNIQNLRFHLQCGFSARALWNNVRMSKISSATSMPLGVLCFLLEFIGVSEVPFEVTQKDHHDHISSDQDFDDHKDRDASKNIGRFTFDESPIFISGTTFLFVQLTALALSLFGHNHDEVGLGEFLYSIFMVLCFWPFVRGLFGRGKYGIPLSIMWKSAGFALIFVYLCRKVSMS